MSDFLNPNDFYSKISIRGISMTKIQKALYVSIPTRGQRPPAGPRTRISSVDDHAQSDPRRRPAFALKQFLRIRDANLFGS